jgi:hypothetical protein
MMAKNRDGVGEFGHCNCNLRRKPLYVKQL